MTYCACPALNTGGSVNLSGVCGGAPFLLFMGLLEGFIRSQCDLEDPCRHVTSKPIELDFDFIVVGGGSAGSVVASRLSEVADWSVLLLEAGGNELTIAQVPSMFQKFARSELDWGFKTEPEAQACLGEPEQRCYWPRGKVLGGTSAINGMMYMRGSRHDYDQWATAGNSGWSYADVLPYFLKSEDNLQLDEMDAGYHARGGYLTVNQLRYHPPLADSILEGARELGYESRDVNGEKHTGFMVTQTTSQHGTRLSAAKAFLRPILKQRSNLFVVLNSTVTKVLVDPENKTAYAVEFVRDNFTHRIYAKKEIIISGGAVNSPQILLLSGVGPKDDLEALNIPVVHDLPGVGKNLHNHVAHFVKFLVNETNTRILNWAIAMEYLLHRTGPMSGNGLSQTTGFVHSKYSNRSVDYPDIQLFFRGYIADCSKTGQIEEQIGEGLRHFDMLPCVLHPKSRGQIKLRSSDPLEHPMIIANYLSDPQDMATLLEGIRFAMNLSETQALRRLGVTLDTSKVRGCETFMFNTDEYWECAIRHKTMPENHQSGSCKMAPISDPDAVVDKELRVHGIANLRVVDASIIPQVTSGNTNAPVIMIAEKASDVIKAAWQ